MAKQKIDYEDEPVVYCARCYSLNIAYEDTIGMDCCGECGCTDFKSSKFETWDKMFTKRYGHKFLENLGDIKNSPIYQMSQEQLKSELYKRNDWKEICKALYPTFPEYLGKTDSIILLFAKLYEDKRMGDFKIELINRIRNKK